LEKITRAQTIMGNIQEDVASIQQRSRKGETSVDQESRAPCVDKMTYKYHDKVAKLFRDTAAPTETVEGYIDIAKEDNPQFDAVGFRAVAMDWDGIWTT